MEDRALSNRKLSKCKYFFVFMACILICWWIASMPSYIEINIPMKPHKTGYFWWEIHYSQLYYADLKGVLYVLRKKSTAYPHNQGWKSTQEAFTYFDKWLINQGWVARQIYSGGDPILPESDLLNARKDTIYQVYSRKDDSYGRYSRISLGMWPNYNDSAVTGINIAIASAKASPLRKLANALED